MEKERKRARAKERALGKQSGLLNIPGHLTQQSRPSTPAPPPVTTTDSTFPSPAPGGCCSHAKGQAGATQYEALRARMRDGGGTKEEGQWNLWEGCLCEGEYPKQRVEKDGRGCW